MTAPVAHAAEAGAGADLLFDEAFLRRLEQLELASRRLTAGRMKGERRSVRRGQSVEFADYRNYSAGDDLRQLDWNVYARLERLFIKLFVEEEDVTVHVLVDASRSMDFGEPNKLTFARRAAGALAYLGLAHLDRVSVAFLGEGRALEPAAAARQGARLRGLQVPLRAAPGAAHRPGGRCPRLRQQDPRAAGR